MVTTTRISLSSALVAGTIGLVFASGCSERSGRVVGEPASTTTVPSRVGDEVGERLPPVDRTSALRRLVETDAEGPMHLARELAQRLGAFLGPETATSVAGGPLTELALSGQPGRSATLAVIQVRYGDLRGDDTTPGYDLLVEMTRSSDGLWVVERIEEATVCSRGTATVAGRQVCR